MNLFIIILNHMVVGVFDNLQKAPAPCQDKIVPEGCDLTFMHGQQAWKIKHVKLNEAQIE